MVEKRGEKEEVENTPESEFKHQVTCSNCGMVYEIRYISEHCRFREGEGYLCMNCNQLIDLSV